MPTSKQSKEALVLSYFESRDLAVRDEVILLYRPLVESIARKLAFNRNDFDDLVQVGSISLLRCLDRYEPAMDTDFSTFATPNIIGEIKHYFRDKGRLVKVPRRMQENYSKVKVYMRQVESEGRSPTIQEIATHTGLSEEEVLESMEVSQTGTVVSLDMPSHRNSSGGEGGTLLETLGVAGHEETVLDKETLKQVVLVLNDREKKIIYYRFFMGLSQMEIAEKLNLSQMHISRLLTSALERLRKAMKHHQ
ncbi:MAG: sigma-70 family RNA polymerase sigma factor [Candidatus Margulisiibacteriota bacterium]